MEAGLFNTIVGGGTAGLVAALLLLIVMFVRETVVPGTIYRAQEKKLARYEELAFKAMTIAERATTKDGAA